MKLFWELEVYVDVVHPKTKENIRVTGLIGVLAMAKMATLRMACS
jgi:hypothetical protein